MAYLSTVASSAFDFQNFFSAKLTSSLTASDTDIPMDTIPSISEGVLVIDWDVAASREVIFFNSKTATKVVCPSAANGRGFDGSTATTHASGANVIMAPVADYFRYIKYIATTSTAAWKALGYTPNSIVDNGNRSYTMVFNSVDLTSFISPGMRVKGTPTTAQPTKCTSLNGTTQYYSKSSPSGMTFTDDFVVSAWVKLSSYAVGVIASRFNGTSGWQMYVSSTGQVVLAGYNAGLGNVRQVQSYQSIPLNKWVHVAVQLDMSTYTATTTTCYVMLGGVDVPAYLTQAGSNPLSLVQAGNLEIGASNGGATPFPGKIAQVAIYSAKVTQANVKLIKNQGITAANCTTYNIVSAYSFDNSITDINTGSANDLTANGSAVATNADSPFGLDSTGTPGTNEWGIVQSASFSTNTTLVVQAPEGSAWPTLPTSSMISAMSYSTEKVPYLFPAQRGKWIVEFLGRADVAQSAPVAGTWYNIGSSYLTVPVGEWMGRYEVTVYLDVSATTADASVALSTANNTNADTRMAARLYVNANTSTMQTINRQREYSFSSPSTYYLNGVKNAGTLNNLWYFGSQAGAYTITFENAYL